MKQFKVYKSSAGSGKTYTLVKAYLSICLKHPEPFYYSRILAITFTNKAAQEMKERILKTLKSFGSEEPLSGGEKNLAEDLCAQLNLSELELRKKAALILTSILHNYADFNISTIDKFSHQLIRTFARDLGIDLNFKVDLDENELLQIVIGRLIDRVGRESDLTKVLISHTLKSVDEGKSWDPTAELLSLAEQTLKEDAISRIMELKTFTPKQAIDLQSKLNEDCKKFELECSTIANDALSLIDSIGLSNDKFYSGGAVPNYFAKLQNLDFKGLDNKSTAVNSVSQEKWSSAKASIQEKEQIEKISDQLTNLFQASELLLEEKLIHYNTKRLISKTLGLLSLLKEIEVEFNTIKQEKNIVPISDFNKKINEVVSNEPMPFIYERLGERFQHIMIDEFQDTSVMQFMNLMPLIEESLAKGEFNMIVGDAKQAIYRFRGGNVEQFAKMPNYIPFGFKSNGLVQQRMETLKANFESIVLDSNYRSDENIVIFNNSFFEKVRSLVPEGVKMILENHQQKPALVNGRGYVEVNFVKEKFSEGNEQHLRHTLSSINAAIEDGYQYKDITILCRTKKQLAKVSQFLNEHQIPIFSSESLLISVSIKVQLLIAVARYVVESIPLHAKAIAEYYLSVNQQEINFAKEFEVLKSHEFQLERYLATKGVELNLNKLKGLGLYDFFETLIRVFDLEGTSDSYLQYLMEHVFEFQQNESIILEDFLKWFDARSDKLSIEMEGDNNSIQMMTVHKSKGLEFPIVIQPFSDRGISSKGQDDYLWIEPNEIGIDLEHAVGIYNRELENSLFNQDYIEEQEKRIMDLVNETYVAFTRPIERLYIITNTISKSSTFTLPYLLKTAKPSDAIDTENGYCFGHRQKALERKLVVDDTKEDEIVYGSLDWKNRIKIATFTKKNSELAAADFGNLYHDIMRDINCKDDIKHSIKAIHLDGRLSEQELKQLEHQLYLTLDHPELQDFFGKSKQAHAERSFFTSDGEIRPDRVIEFEDEVIILDYKTGQPKSEDIKQLQTYVLNLQSVYQQEVKGKLYYLKNNEVVSV